MTTRPPIIHELKCHPEYFDKVWSGEKTFEFRKDDRDFRVFDTLWLREWCPVKCDYSDRSIYTPILYVARGGLIPEGFAVMSIAKIQAAEAQPAASVKDRVAAVMENKAITAIVGQPAGDAVIYENCVASIRELEAAGMGKPGKPNTLVAMATEARGAIASLQAELAAAKAELEKYRAEEAEIQTMLIDKDPTPRTKAQEEASQRRLQEVFASIKKTDAMTEVIMERDAALANLAAMTAIRDGAEAKIIQQDEVIIRLRGELENIGHKLAQIVTAGKPAMEGLRAELAALKAEVINAMAKLASLKGDILYIRDIASYGLGNIPADPLQGYRHITEACDKALAQPVPAKSQTITLEGDSFDPKTVAELFAEAALGTEEGELCRRDGCAGIIGFQPVKDCSCHISPPCEPCVSNPLRCPMCGWEAVKP